MICETPLPIFSPRRVRSTLQFKRHSYFLVLSIAGVFRFHRFLRGSMKHDTADPTERSRVEPSRPEGPEGHRIPPAREEGSEPRELVAEAPLSATFCSVSALQPRSAASLMNHRRKPNHHLIRGDNDFLFFFCFVFFSFIFFCFSPRFVKR